MTLYVFVTSNRIWLMKTDPIVDNQYKTCFFPHLQNLIYKSIYFGTVNAGKY